MKNIILILVIILIGLFIGKTSITEAGVFIERPILAVIFILVFLYLLIQ